jgi:transcription antitermination factor NusG
MKPLSSAFSPEVMAELARPFESYDPRNAEIATGVDPKWYVFEIAARDVEAELAKRRFGVYVPECQETIIRRGRPVDRRIQLFPGYVFVFVWPTAANWSLIVSTRGIVGSIGSLTDAEIDQIRYLENCERPIVLECFDEVQTVASKRKRWRKKPKQVVVSVPDEIVKTRAWSAFDDIVHSLDGEGRSEALRQMLDESRLA